MLYITTRNKTDSYTAYRALHEGVASDGGQFLPIRLPLYTSDQLESLKNKTFNEIVADILNVFFSAHLTGWDIEFAIGRKPVKLLDIGRKITVAELWRNTENSFRVCVKRIYNLLCGNKANLDQPCGWAVIAIRIAFIFGLYGELSRMDINTFDTAASGQDLEAVVALWYARRMGLPIGRIICGSNENCWIWDLIHKGEVNTGSAPIQTDAPDMDTLPAGMERLIYGSLGLEDNLRYLEACDKKVIYQVAPQKLPALNQGLFSSVVGKSRVRDVISSVYSTNNYLLDPYTAISYGALQDYRAKSGENRITLLMTEESPARYASVISQATGLSDREISKR